MSRRARRGRSPLQFAAVALCAVGLLAGCGAAASPSPSASRPNPGNLLMGRSSLGMTTAPNFTLTNQFGQSVSLSDFRGKVVLLAFTDSQCTTICPLTTANMVSAVHMLGKAGQDVRIVNIDANPQAISVKDVYDYASVHGILHTSDFLTGSLSQLEHVWKLYHIDVQIVHGNIDHTPALFLIDQQGRERYLYLTNARYGVLGQESRILAYDIAHALPKGTAKAPSLPRSTADPRQSPDASVTLPALAPGTQPTTLAKGKPRVVVLFASWVPDAVTQLRSLEAYATWARQHGGPELVAIDELQTEPSLATARSRLQGLGVSFPVLLDRTGAVADAYRAQDMPWFSLVSAKGKIIDSHDGWVSGSQLISRVEKDYAIQP